MSRFGRETLALCLHVSYMSVIEYIFTTSIRTDGKASSEGVTDECMYCIYSYQVCTKYIHQNRATSIGATVFVRLKEHVCTIYLVENLGHPMPQIS